MRIFAFVSICGLAAGSLTTLHAQSLVDVAKKEGERRQTVKSSTRVYSNEDLKPADPAPDPAAAGDASAAPEKKTADEKTDVKADSRADAKGNEKGADGKAGDGKAGDKVPARDAKAGGNGEGKDQEYWGGKMRALNEQLERDRLYAEAIQTRINSLTADFSARDDPAQRSLIADDRQKAVSEMSRLLKQIEEDKDAIGNLEEEARHAGVPPGWLR